MNYKEKQLIIEVAKSKGWRRTPFSNMTIMRSHYKFDGNQQGGWFISEDITSQPFIIKDDDIKVYQRDLQIKKLGL